jgi:hypothetical protein
VGVTITEEAVAAALDIHRKKLRKKRRYALR